MLDFSRRHIEHGEGLLTSELLNEKTFYDRLIDDMIDAQSEVFIESPFVKRDRALSLLPYYVEL